MTYVGTFIVLDPDEDSWFETETKTLPAIKKTSHYDPTLQNPGGQVTTVIYGAWKNSGSPYGQLPGSMNSRPTIVNRFDQQTASTGVANEPPLMWLYQFKYPQKQTRTRTTKTIGWDWVNSTKTTKVGPTRNALFCRPKTLKFIVTGLKPSTKHHIFFKPI